MILMQVKHILQLILNKYWFYYYSLYQELLEFLLQELVNVLVLH